MHLRAFLISFIIIILCYSFMSDPFHFADAQEQLPEDPLNLPALYYDPSNNKPEYRPVYVTDYLEDAKGIADIRRRSQMPMITHKSYSGFFTVDRKYCFANLFFWFFESPTRPKDKPVVLWLHGGPGYTFFTTVFKGNGPFWAMKGIFLSKTSWTRDFNVLYIDNPVGTSYSFTDHLNCYSRTVQHAADHLHNAVRQFYMMFPEYKNTEFYITGEGYAGKYIPVLASMISWHNQQAISQEINLKGLFIGCGFIDPPNQMIYADPLYEMGIISQKGRKKARHYEHRLHHCIKQGKYWRAAYYIRRIGQLVCKSKSLKENYFCNLHVMMTFDGDNGFNSLKDIMNNEVFRRDIHSGYNSFHRNMLLVLWYFRKDIFQSVSSYLSEVIHQYKVLLYSGDRDFITPPVQIDRVISNLDWADLPDFRKAKRQPWYVEGNLAGYKKSFKNLTQVVVHDATHFIVRSQPLRVAELLKSFVNNTL